MNTKETALITGVTGQGGSYLSKFLIDKVMRFMASIEEHLPLILLE